MDQSLKKVLDFINNGTSDLPMLHTLHLELPYFFDTENMKFFIREIQNSWVLGKGTKNRPMTIFINGTNAKEGICIGIQIRLLVPVTTNKIIPLNKEFGIKAFSDSSGLIITKYLAPSDLKVNNLTKRIKELANEGAKALFIYAVDKPPMSLKIPGKILNL